MFAIMRAIVTPLKRKCLPDLTFDKDTREFGRKNENENILGMVKMC